MKIASVLFVSVSILLIISSCKKNSTKITTPPSTTPTILKNASTPPVGVGISYSLMKNNINYSSLVKTQFDRVTAEYQMKHGANVKNDGTFDFTNTDDF